MPGAVDIGVDWIYDADAMRVEEEKSPFRTLVDLSDNELTNRQSHELGERLARVPDMEHALRLVAELIEGTYPHDEKGSREDGDNSMSNADVCDELCQLEKFVFKALNRKPGIDIPDEKDEENGS